MCVKHSLSPNRNAVSGYQGHFLYINRVKYFGNFDFFFLQDLKLSIAFLKDTFYSVQENYISIKKNSFSNILKLNLSGKNILSIFLLAK